MIISMMLEHLPEIHRLETTNTITIQLRKCVIDQEAFALFEV